MKANIRTNSLGEEGNRALATERTKTADSTELEKVTTHWVKLLTRLLEGKSHRSFYATAHAYANRLKRRSPEELSLVSDSLRNAIAKTPPRSDPPAGGELRYLLEFLLELTKEVYYSSSEERAKKQWMEFSQTPHFKAIITHLSANEMTGKSLSDYLQVGPSRVSQILSTMQLASLIQFTQRGQYRYFSLTELGRACASYLGLDQVHDYDNTDRLKLMHQTTDVAGFVSKELGSLNEWLNSEEDALPPASIDRKSSIISKLVNAAVRQLEQYPNQLRSTMDEASVVPAFTWDRQRQSPSSVE
jgi:hypothetical protein